MEKIIYQKKFPKATLEEIENEIWNGENENRQEKEINFDEMVKKLYSDVTFLVLPDKVKKAKNFIQSIIEISNAYELDVEIKDNFSYISATFFIECCIGMGFLKKIIQMADDISFCTHIDDYDLAITLDYYTKALCRKGRPIQP